MTFGASGERDFRALVEAATDAILVIGHAGDILYANDAAGDLFRSRPEALEGLPFGHPLVHGQTVELDVPLAGEARIAEMRASSVTWEGEAASVAILRDVSERVRLTASLQDRLRFEELLLAISAGFARASAAEETPVSTEALGLLAGHAGVDVACLVAVEGEAPRVVACHPAQDCPLCRPGMEARLTPLLREVNRAAELPLSLRRDEVAAASDLETVFREAGMAWLGLVPLRAGKQPYGVLCLARRDGPPSPTPERDLDTLRPVAAVLVDSLRRMRAEALLTTAVAKQAAVFQQAVEGLALLHGGTILQVNQALAQMFGYEPQDMEGMDTRVLFASDEGYQALTEHGVPLIRAGKVVTAEHLFQRRTGERFWVEIKGALVATTAPVAETVWVLRDVTVEREEGRRKEQLIEELRRSNAELERFAFIASHDLKEPVRMVASYVNLLARRHGDDLGPEGREFLSYALEGARRIHKMIEGILEYARIEKGVADLVPVALDETLARVQEDLKDTIRESGAVIKAEGLPIVLGVPSEMERLFANLIGNAIKFSRPNETPQVCLASQRAEGAMWHVTVSDNGIGIPVQDRERVFDLFWRLHSRESVEGTGLGLAIVKRIIERRGGRVWLESRSGEGTTMHLLLPAADSRVEAAPEMEHVAPV
ncbi:ATP-binding protein [Pararhodospirillum oryzae]|uniref:histidine kinase n=1 Tax=Pararhodospirillum oryzae TaxID=478448 RepID=A0A512H784_9PROT|nr:ATP-binding protein [Pararhodospirillum oryzae]GEO81316.1 PAS domain-containing sensor histidine kinase [Pararhodospirillum oryzae]